MSIITIRLSDKLCKELDDIVHAEHISRTEYIRRAIECMNKKILSRKQTERLKKLSLQVRNESMRINAEFDEIEHDPEI